MRHAGDGLGTGVLRQRAGGTQNAVGHEHIRLRVDGEAAVIHVGQVFYAHDGAHHRADYLGGVGPHGGLGREHHGVGAVNHGVGHVGGFGTGGARGRYHALHHLGSYDDGLAQRVALGNYHLLHHGHLLHLYLHAEVAAGHHHGVGFGDDGVEVAQALGRFNLGDDAGGFAAVGDDFLDEANVLGAAGKAQGHPVHVVFQAKLQVLNVLLRHGRGRHVRIGQVDALARLYQSPVHHLHVYLRLAVGGQHLQLNLAVVDENHVARLHVAGQLQVDGAQARSRADFLLAAHHLDAVAGLDFHRAALHLAEADFGALQVLQQAHGRAQVLVEPPHEADDGQVVVVAAVREVEPEHVHALPNQGAQALVGVGGGAHGGHNLGFIESRTVIHEKAEK